MKGWQLDRLGGRSRFNHVERVRKRDEERAIALLRAHVDTSDSLCNTSRFVVMESLRIREAVAFDRHF